MNPKLTQFILTQTQNNQLTQEEATQYLTNQVAATSYILSLMTHGILSNEEATHLLSTQAPAIQMQQQEEDDDLILIIREGQRVAVPRKQLTNEELVALFFEDIEKTSDPKTVNCHRNDLPYFVNWWKTNYGDYAYWRMTHREAEEFVHYIQHEVMKEDGSEYSVSWRNRVKSSASRFYEFMDDRHALLNQKKDREKRNEIHNLPHLEEEEKKDRVLTFNECVKLLQTIKHSKKRGRTKYTTKRNYCFYRFLLRMGTRIEETTLLKIEDINFETRELDIKKEYTKFKKGRKVMIPEDVMEDIKDYLAFREALGIESEFLFCSGTGKKIDAKDSNEALMTYLIEAGIDCEGDNKVTNHTFRHTYITHEIHRHERDSVEIAKHVGHANTQMIQDRYLKATDRQALGIPETNEYPA